MPGWCEVGRMLLVHLHLPELVREIKERNFVWLLQHLHALRHPLRPTLIVGCWREENIYLVLAALIHDIRCPGLQDRAGIVMPEKSRGSRHAATRMFRVVAGVLRLLPTKRGSPAVTTAPTAAISPLRIAERASLFVPPSGASIRTMSAALPALSAPQSRRYTRALLPVAAAMAISGAMPARLDRCAIV